MPGELGIGTLRADEVNAVNQVCNHSTTKPFSCPSTPTALGFQTQAARGCPSRVASFLRGFRDIFTSRGLPLRT